MKWIINKVIAILASAYRSMENSNSCDFEY